MADPTLKLVDLTGSDEEKNKQLTLAVSHSQKSPSSPNWENLISKKHRQYIDEVEQEKENRYNLFYFHNFSIKILGKKS